MRSELSPRLTARIADIDNICGIKIGRPIDHYVAVKALCGDRIVVSHPSEADCLELMRHHGQRVHMSSAAPFTLQTPAWRPMREYVELALAGRFDEAERVSSSMSAVRVVAEKWLRDPWVEQKVLPIAQLKAWSESFGLAGGAVRTPLLGLGAQELEALRADLDRIGLKERRDAEALTEA